jgi:hypothetical protein
MPAIDYFESHGYQPAGSHQLPEAKAAEPVGLPPELEARLARFRAGTVGDQLDPVCPACRSEHAPGAGTTDGYCRHRQPPGLKAIEEAERRHAYATMQAQLLGRTADHGRVIDHASALQEDSYFGRPAPIDRVNLTS